MPPKFEARDDDDELVVSDPITRRRYPLGVDAGVEPEPVPADGFWYPVTTAVAIETTTLRMPTVVATFVRDGDGEMLSHCDYDDVETHPAGEYIVDVHPPVKLYLRFSGPFTVRTTKETRTIEFAEPTRVAIGARSYHDEPAATVTTTADPADVMAAISTFGSALKTTDPEHSFPTLRGHPPFVDLGDDLHVPDTLDVPDTGVTLELPPDLGHVLPAASLAFYTGADVVQGSDPTLVTDSGFAYDLSRDADYQAEIERVLQQVFLLDCVTRTDGIYPIELRERALAEERLDLDFPALYDAPMGERVERYLGVEFDAIADLVPEWRLAVDCRPDTEVVEYLPFVANDLGFARPFEPEPASPAPEMVAAVDEFSRNGTPFTRSGGEASEESEEPPVQPRSKDTLETAWAGTGRPLTGGKLLREGFEHVFERPETEGDIEVAVVCNDDEMAAEYEDGNLYGELETLPFQVDEYTNLSVEEFRDLLTTRFDFLHYIGHLEDDRFVCSDGSISVDEMTEIGPFAFLLNGCKSYEQGVKMIEAGSAAGIVTNERVGNNGAVTVGQHLARLLNRGFSVQGALNVVRKVELAGTAYVSVGASNHPVIQTDHAAPAVYHPKEVDEGIEVEMYTYPSATRGTGLMVRPYFDNDAEFSLAPGQVHVPGVISVDEFRYQVALERMPVLRENELEWIDSDGCSS